MPRLWPQRSGLKAKFVGLKCYDLCIANSPNPSLFPPLKDLGTKLQATHYIHSKSQLARSKNFYQDLGRMAGHIPPLIKAKKQGEMPFASSSPSGP